MSMGGLRGLKAVLFDAAGTLIELREPVGETYSRVARDHGVEFSTRRLGEAFARIFRNAPPMAFPGADPSELAALEKRWWRDVVRSTFRAADGAARIRDFDACFETLYAAFSGPDAWRAAHGARETLALLRQAGLVTAVVSNFDGRLPGILAGLDLAPLLDAVVLPAHAGTAKPDPRIFVQALERVGASPSESVYVGDDHENDVRAARAAGLRAVDVTTLATLLDLPAHLEAVAREPRT